MKESKEELAYRVALDMRNFEIELFWRRSLFFWGFISVAFAGYAALWPRRPWLAFVVACSGMVFSFAWVLINRGSKYWQEAWEAQVEELEDAVTGPLFQQEYHKAGSPLIGGRRFSVSRVTIALSIYVFLIWVGLVLWHVLRVTFPVDLGFLGLLLVMFFSVGYLWVLHAQKGRGDKV